MNGVGIVHFSRQGRLRPSSIKQRNYLSRKIASTSCSCGLWKFAKMKPNECRMKLWLFLWYSLHATPTHYSMVSSIYWGRPLGMSLIMDSIGCKLWTENQSVTKLCTCTVDVLWPNHCVVYSMDLSLYLFIVLVIFVFSTANGFFLVEEFEHFEQTQCLGKASTWAQFHRALLAENIDRC